MKQAVEALGRGDAAPYEAVLHDNVVWRSPAFDVDPDADGVRLGRDSVSALLEKIAEATADFSAQWRARDIVSRGDIVWGVFGNDNAPGNSGMMVRWRMQDGKIIHAQTFN
jgi:ketosteroid isomerase-like protein